VTRTTSIDPKLKEYCSTDRQRQYIDSVNEHKGVMAAAAALGIGFQSVSEAISKIKERAALKGYSPEHHLTRPIAPGLKMRGTSQLYKQGQAEPVLEWVKTSADEERRMQVIRDAFDIMASDLPRIEPVERPAMTHESLCNLYTLTDSHVGALAWHKETASGDWDLSIAERVLTGCFEHMVNSSPKAKVAFVNQLGDFLHTDGTSGMAAVTPLHGNNLDADGRFSKMVQTAVRILRRVVDFALTRHEKVVVLMAEGNHDMASSVWLRVLFRALYENEPRVEVIDSELPYYCYRHGKTMLAFHHGHLKKNDQLPILFAAQFPKIWGDTEKRYAHCGHRHHVEEKEHSGLTVIQHPTLAARDAYAARGGWIADRAVTAITYHSEYGQVARTTVVPEMLG
jgi:hypothetical protein